MGVWSHVAVTFDGYDLSLYVNGQPDGCIDTKGFTNRDPTTHCLIGASRCLGKPTSGESTHTHTHQKKKLST